MNGGTALTGSVFQAPATPCNPRVARGRRSSLIAAERAAFEVAFVPLAEARALVELYAQKGDRKYERAALKYLRWYLDEADPSLVDVAQVAALLAERSLVIRGL